MGPRPCGYCSVASVGTFSRFATSSRKPTSRIAVTGLYLYGPDIMDITSEMRPSPRGEIEITDVNRVYLTQGRLNFRNLGRGIAWLDGGTPEDLYEASQFVKVVQDRTGLRVACPEEIAYRAGYISAEQLQRLAAPLAKSQYGRYLLDLLKS